MLHDLSRIYLKGNSGLVVTLATLSHLQIRLHAPSVATMRSPRLFFMVLLFALLLTSLSYFALLSDDQDEYMKRRDPGSFLFKNLFAFQNPASLFAPGATISLTDDNSTYFAARPAAFGPYLPTSGLSGQLWVGSGFSQDRLTGTVSMHQGGELGCGDMLDEYMDFRQADSAHGVNGKVALLMRGTCAFAEKVLWAQRRGALAVVVGDNVPGGDLVQMYAHGDTSNITIPSCFTSHTTAHLLLTLMHDVSSDQESSGPSTVAGSRASLSGEPAYDLGESGSVTPPHGRGGKHRLHEGLWVTLTPTNMSTSPFLNTLFVLVVSPLVTLSVVYAMLLIRSRIRRRRWRAPKSLVERLPVRIYHTSSRTSSNTSSNGHDDETHPDAPEQASSTTPLLIEPAPEAEVNEGPSSSRYGSFEQHPAEAEKAETGLAAWRRKYGGKQVECVICLEDYVDGVSKVMQLPCGHEFHAECMLVQPTPEFQARLTNFESTPWLTTRRRTCPICKGDIVRSMTGEVLDDLDEPLQRVSSDDVQAQAAGTINTSPSAALPVPSHSPQDLEDLEVAHHQRLVELESESMSESWRESVQRYVRAFRVLARHLASPSTADPPRR